MTIFRPKNSKKSEFWASKIKKGQNGANLSKTTIQKTPFPHYEKWRTPGALRGTQAYIFTFLPIYRPNFGRILAISRSIEPNFVEKRSKKCSKSTFHHSIVSESTSDCFILCRIEVSIFQLKNDKNDFFHTFAPIWITVCDAQEIAADGPAYPCRDTFLKET